MNLTAGFFDCPNIGCVLTVGASIVFTIGVCLLPDSPRYLCYKNRLDVARAVLSKFRNVDADTEKLLFGWTEPNATEKARGLVGFLRQPGLPTRKVLIVLGLLVSQQLLGVTAILFSMEKMFSLTRKLVHTLISAAILNVNN